MENTNKMTKLAPVVFVSPEVTKQIEKKTEQKKTENSHAGAGRGNPHQGFLRYDPARHHPIFIRPLYRR